MGCSSCGQRYKSVVVPASTTGVSVGRWHLPRPVAPAQVPSVKTSVPAPSSKETK